MISANELYTIRVSQLEAGEQADRLNAEQATIDIVAYIDYELK